MCSSDLNELAAAQKCLGVCEAEAHALLAPIVASGATHDQITERLRSSWSSFQRLRDTLAPLTEQQILAAPPLASAGAIDLDQLAAKLNAALKIDTKSNNDPALTGKILEALALVALVMQRFRDAAQYFERAADAAKNDPAQAWRYQLQRAQALQELGCEFLDDEALQEARVLYQTIVLPAVNETRDPQAWATAQTKFGTLLGIQGQRQNGTRTLAESITAFENAVRAHDPKTHPLDWASAQNGLGNALGILAHRQNDPDMLEAAVDAFDQALTKRSQDHTPWDWATTQNNLGSVLQSLGQRKNDVQLLKRSVEAYKLVLLVWTRDRAPLHWATTFNNLGTALRTLGEKRKGPRTLEQAVAAYRNALAERARERVPQQWAMTQNNLGTALQKLGERTEELQHFNEAIAAYQNALREWTQETVPITWAMTTANLAIAQKSLAERMQDPGTAGLALSNFEAVAKVFRSASHAQYYEYATEQIAKTRELMRSLS